MNDRGVRVDGPPGAPALVLSNSLGCSADMWAPQMPALTQRFRVVRYEHRGHGGTEAPGGSWTIDDLGSDLLAVMGETGVDRASVVGLSLGGTVAMWLAINHPDRVDRLVIACSRASWPPKEMWADRIEKVRAGRPSDLLGALLGRWFTPGFRQAHPEAALLVESMLDAASPEGYAGCCEALAEVDLGAGLGAIRAPALILAGAADPGVPIAASASLAESIAGSSLRVISPGAHLLNLEQPDRFNAAVIDHLAGDAVERGRATRREVLGEAHVAASEADAGAITSPFVDLITRYAWGDVWTRPGLDRRTRSCITLAMLVALGRFDELGMHLLGARRNGLSDEEIVEVLLQTAVYCGVPAANSAFAVARRVLEERSGAAGD